MPWECRGGEINTVLRAPGSAYFKRLQLNYCLKNEQVVIRQRSWEENSQAEETNAKEENKNT